jgi:hypothetical protein
MKKFNLLQEIITVDRAALTAAINTPAPFGITIAGQIHHPPYDARQCYIFQGSVERPAVSLMQPAKTKSLSQLLGGNMQVVEDGDRVMIKAGRDWQQIMGYNLPHSDYDDTTGDGVAEFTDEKLEAIGWQATEFGIGYRELVDIIEEACDGTLLCIEHEGEHYQFSGMGFIDDMECARKRCFDYCVEKIQTIVKEDATYRLADLTDDEEEALTFFGIALTVPPFSAE